MTYQEAMDELKKIVPQGSLMIKFEYWENKDDGYGVPWKYERTSTFSAWSANRQEHTDACDSLERLVENARVKWGLLKPDALAEANSNLSEPLKAS